MPATFNIPTQLVIPGQLIASALWNGEFKNIFDNLTPGGIDDYSQTSTQMQIQTDPFPGSVISLPTGLNGELERLRFIVSGMIGENFWYQGRPTTIDGPITLQSIAAYMLGHDHGGTGVGAAGDYNRGRQLPTEGLMDGSVTFAKLAATERFASGTKMAFFQAAAPTGWTQITTHNDKALRVVSGSGGGSGGSQALSTTLAHSHVVDSHQHIISAEGVLTTDTGSAASLAQSGGQQAFTHDSHVHHVPAHSHGGATGAASVGTNSQLGALAYVDMILCSKN